MSQSSSSYEDSSEDYEALMQDIRDLPDIEEDACQQDNGYDDYASMMQDIQDLSSYSDEDSDYQ